MLCSMIKAMEDKTCQLNKRSKTSDNDNDLDDGNWNDNPSSDELTADFTDCIAAVMKMCLDSAAATSGMGCGLVDVVSEVALSTGDKFILVEDAWNSVIVVFRPNVPPSTGSRALQLVTLARKVIDMVRLH